MVVENQLKKTPEIIQEIQEILKYEIAGDPINGSKWIGKTTEKIAKILQENL